MLKNLFMPWHRIAVITIPLLLAACSTVQQNGASNTAATASTQRHYAQKIDIAGRLSIFYSDAKGEKKAAHGSFNWNQTSQSTDVTLFSPLGQTVAKIHSTPTEATLYQADRDPVQADDVDMLTANMLDWPLPIQGLKDWLQGFGKNSQHQTFNATINQESEITTDSGWRLSYLRWAQNRNGEWYPERINLNRQSEQAGDIAIRLVIDSSFTK